MARLASLTITIPANGRLVQKVSGTYLFIKSASGAFDLRIDGQETIPADTNTEVMETVTWKDLEFINNSGSPINIVFFYGDGSVKTNGITFTGNLELKAAAVLETIADTALAAAVATQILPSDMSRKEVIISNDTGANIRIGDAATDAARGVLVGNGAAITLETTAAIYGYSVGGGNVSVTVLKSV